MPAPFDPIETERCFDALVARYGRASQAATKRAPGVTYGLGSATRRKEARTWQLLGSRDRIGADISRSAWGESHANVASGG